MSGISEPERIYNYYALLPDSEGRRLLFTYSEKGWTLPHFATTQPYFWQATAHVNYAMLEALGLETTVLRCVLIELDPDIENCVRLVHALDNHDPSWQAPEGTHWVDEKGWKDLPLAHSWHEPLVASWYAECSQPASLLRVPWEVPGWFQEAQAWIKLELGQRQVGQVGQVGQLRAWGRSCVMRVPLTSGNVYFKALPKMFAHEISLIQWLAERFPRNFPTFLAVDSARHWMLMPDFGGQLLSDVRDIVRWEEALGEYASIQAELTSHRDVLLRLGCPDMRLSILSEGLDSLISDEALLSVDPDLLAERDIIELRNMAPALKNMCQELDAIGIPPTLDHGDFWPQNIIARSDGSYMFFDWSDVSLTHPFFSMSLYSSKEAELPSVLYVEERLRDAYLEPWEKFASRDQLLHAYDLAQKLAPLHMALFYQQHILPNMERKWEMENMPPYLLKRLLEGLKREI